MKDLTENILTILLVIALCVMTVHFYGRELSGLVAGQFEKLQVAAGE